MRRAFAHVDAGHLLGSAMVHLRIAGTPRDLTLTYTGDLGRRQLPLHGPPADQVLAQGQGAQHDAGMRNQQSAPARRPVPIAGSDGRLNGDDSGSCAG